MALTREDLQSLLRWLDEDPEFRAALRQKLLAEPLIIEIRMPTDWMAKVDTRLDKLEKTAETQIQSPERSSKMLERLNKMLKCSKRM
ncbi:MAG: hypothetical protein RMK89_08735 [Armatimonadota bacterium]|nr:hypothetical protein [Armatimonadota bacterium]MDW8143532.1 hypothetical protein [Armatimonadota bacterium]